uniref:N-acetyltransferase domain-containing protein n=1 Tax=Sinocyclocheilus grahami TaxID=75366 RepID=A0A672TBH1_SINGR
AVSSIIGPYKSTDKSAIVSLFHFGILEHVYPAFFKAMSHPNHIGSSYFQAVLRGGAWACLVYYCCHEIYDAYLRRKLETEVADIQANFSDSQANGFWVVAMELNGKSKVAGLLAAVKSDGWDADAVDTPSLEAFQLVVSFNQRRKGLGTQLLVTAVEFCKEQGLSRVIVEISSLQTAAISLFRKLGFTVTFVNSNTHANHLVSKLARINVIVNFIL